MLKKLIITLIFACSFGVSSVHAMQQQQVQAQRQQQQQRERQRQKPAQHHTHDGCDHPHNHEPATPAPQEQQQQQEQTSTTENTAQDTSTETNEEVHVHEWAPEHGRCCQCGCDGMSAFGQCSLATSNFCGGRPHILTCITCGITKLSIED